MNTIDMIDGIKSRWGHRRSQGLLAALLLPLLAFGQVGGGSGGIGGGGGSGGGGGLTAPVALSDLATQDQATVVGRAAGTGTGVPIALTASQIRALANVADGATAGGTWGTDIAGQPAVVGQAEAEAGVATTERIWTAERVAQAIAALAAGGGDMLSATYDPTNVAGNAFDMENMIEGATTKIMTDGERDKLAAIQVVQPPMGIGWQFDADWTVPSFPGGAIGSGAMRVNETILDSVSELYCSKFSIGGGFRLDDYFGNVQLGDMLLLTQSAQDGSAPYDTKFGLYTVTAVPVAVDDDWTVEVVAVSANGLFTHNAAIGLTHIPKKQPAIVSQGDAEAGTSTDPKMWTPERVGQAIAALAPGGGGGGGIDVQKMEVSGLWTRPEGFVSGEVILISGGGGGGSGRRGASETHRSGGGSGSGGGIYYFTIGQNVDADVYVYVGAGGLGGEAPSVDDEDGQNGLNGGYSQFGVYWRVDGGNGGEGGSSSGGAAGGARPYSVARYPTTANPANGFAGGAGAIASGGHSIGPTNNLGRTNNSGGGGGGVNDSNVGGYGGNVGGVALTIYGDNTETLPGGIADSEPGLTSEDRHNSLMGVGGSGGAGNTLGGGLNGFTGGNGGDGADGVVIVISYLE